MLGCSEGYTDMVSGLCLASISEVSAAIKVSAEKGMTGQYATMPATEEYSLLEHLDVSLTLSVMCYHHRIQHWSVRMSRLCWAAVSLPLKKNSFIILIVGSTTRM
jgi:hypothetical protein